MKKVWIILLLLIAVFAGIRVATLDDNTTFVPFSGRIFDFEVQEISDVFIQNGTTGVRTTEAETAEVAAALNGLRSRLWFPKLPNLKNGGWSYRAVVVDGNIQKSFYLGNGPIPWICVNGIVYILSGEQAAALTAFAD